MGWGTFVWLGAPLGLVSFPIFNDPRRVQISPAEGAWKSVIHITYHQINIAKPRRTNIAFTHTPTKAGTRDYRPTAPHSPPEQLEDTKQKPHNRPQCFSTKTPPPYATPPPACCRGPRWLVWPTCTDRIALLRSSSTTPSTTSTRHPTSSPSRAYMTRYRRCRRRASCGCARPRRR